MREGKSRGGGVEKEERVREGDLGRPPGEWPLDAQKRSELRERARSVPSAPLKLFCSHVYMKLRGGDEVVSDALGPLEFLDVELARSARVSGLERGRRDVL